jgi:hypothetical protein
MAEPIRATLSDGQSLWFQRFTGVIVEDSKRTETEITSSTWATRTPNGSYAQTLVGSNLHRTHAIWLRSPEGQEREFSIPSHGFSARPSHDVTIVWGAAEGYGEGYHLLAINHTTSGVWSLPVVEDPEPHLIKSFKLKNGWMTSLFHIVAWTIVMLIAVRLLTILAGAREPGVWMGLALCGPAEIGGLIAAGVVLVRRGVRKMRRVAHCMDILAAEILSTGKSFGNDEIARRLATKLT